MHMEYSVVYGVSSLRSWGDLVIRHKGRGDRETGLFPCPISASDIAHMGIPAHNSVFKAAPSAMTP